MDIKKIREATAEELIKKRIVMVEGDIFDATPTFIQNSILSLDAKSSKEIFLFFWSNGGDADSGLLIHDTLQSLRSPTIGIVGFAGSAAGIILQGCTKRQIFKSGRIAIHSPAINIKEFRFNEWFDERIKCVKERLEVNKQRMEEIYLEKSKISSKALKEIIRKGDLFDEWMYAPRVHQLGLVDEILDDNYVLFGKSR